MIQNSGLKNTYGYYFYKIVILLYVSSLFSGSVHAAEWKNNIGVGVDLSSYDNITLAAPGNERGDLIAQIRPFISSKRSGGRTNLDLRYQLQLIKYKENKQNDDIYHQLFFNLDSEIAEDLFFLDLRATNFQSIISGAGSIPQDNVSISNNRTNVSTLLFSPYVDTKVAANTYMLIKYTITKTRYTRNVLGDRDTYNQTALFNLRNTEGSANFGWILDYKNNKFDSSQYADSNFQQASIDLRLQKSEQLIPYARLGYEKNSIQNTIYKQGGNFWVLGFEWLPTRHTSIKAEKGNRFYGDSALFSWVTKSKWFTVGVDYKETVTSTSSVFNKIIPDENLSPGETNEIQPIRLNPFIRKRLSSSFIYGKAKSKISWTLYDEKRFSLTNAGNDKLSGTTLAWNLLIGRLTNSVIRGGWNKIYQENTGLENRLYNLGYTITRQTRSGKSRIISSLSLLHRRQDSDLDSFNYTQNILKANVNIVF